MNHTVLFFVLLLVFLIVQRLAELKIASRNTAKLLKTGAVEFGGKHYWVLVALHTAFFLSLIAEASGRALETSKLWSIFLTIFIVAQMGRVWVIRSMHGRWTTRIIVSPGKPLVNQGPFQYIPHPNYTIVAVELFVIPMLFNLYLTSAVFTVANVCVLLFIRLPEETRALRWASGEQKDHNQTSPHLSKISS
ncbi:MAG: hypothetical protein H7301_06625 [Cryobacterium sp.]|nr:hypothetical protein [Oligoflexia bacterium]